MEIVSAISRPDPLKSALHVLHTLFLSPCFRQAQGSWKLYVKDGRKIKLRQTRVPALLFGENDPLIWNTIFGLQENEK